jgi:hypothetical protein
MVASAAVTPSGVDNQQGHVRGFQVAPSHHYAHLFGHQVRLALAADAGRIHKAQLLALELDHLVHRVARSAGDGRNNGARRSCQRIQQRGFAHIGPPDDGHRGLVLLKLAVGAVR